MWWSLLFTSIAKTSQRYICLRTGRLWYVTTATYTRNFVKLAFQQSAKPFASTHTLTVWVALWNTIWLVLRVDDLITTMVVVSLVCVTLIYGSYYGYFCCFCFGLVASWLAYTNSVLFGCPQKHAARLQRVQQELARVVKGSMQSSRSPFTLTDGFPSNGESDLNLFL